MREPEEVEAIFEDLRHSDTADRRTLLDAQGDPCGHVLPLRYFRGQMTSAFGESRDTWMKPFPLEDAITIEEYIAWAVRHLPIDVAFRVYGDTEVGVTFIVPIGVPERSWFAIAIENGLQDEFIQKLQDELLRTSLWRRQHGAEVRDDSFYPAGALMKASCRFGKHWLLSPQGVPGGLTYRRCACGKREELKAE